MTMEQAFTPAQINSMRRQVLTLLVRGMLSSNEELTSLSFKNKVHETGANRHFDNNEFTQKQSSDFLKGFYEENQLEVRRIGVSNPVFHYKYELSGLNDMVFSVGNGRVVCYNRNNPLQYKQSNVRKYARKAAKECFNIEYDLLNTCSAEHFKNIYLKK